MFAADASVAAARVRRRRSAAQREAADADHTDAGRVDEAVLVAYVLLHTLTVVRADVRQPAGTGQVDTGCAGAGGSRLGVLSADAERDATVTAEGRHRARAGAVRAAAEGGRVVAGRVRGDVMTGAARGCTPVTGEGRGERGTVDRAGCTMAASSRVRRFSNGRYDSSVR